ncbi:hypothetical protein BZA05DRAFT_471564 [Tricharina praecox]|uniref:uncharacterized protein n=1 Tax=Tricharina praecox TaxID=43433 RepID=UPI00221E3D45|nr:uncharacterized protein BZA05DRAFT_471564 [Tricharina praecox]KAI5856507.1 hypothetical protein BZA05DRAFT_471564 [Tricharina praecox]
MPRRKNRSRHILRPSTPTHTATNDDSGSGDGGGWSTIPGRHRGTLHLHLSSAAPFPTPPTTTTATTSAHPPRSQGDLTAALSRAQRMLDGHALLRPLHDALPRDVRDVRDVWEILVLGLGSLHSATAPSSMLQLAMVLSILPWLEGTGKAPEIRFVDPVFTNEDLEFLGQFGGATTSTTSTGAGAGAEGEGEGMTEQEKEESKEEVKEEAKEATKPAAAQASTILLAPHLDFSVLHSYLSHCASTSTMPSVILSNDVRRFLELRIGEESEWKVFRRLMREEGEYEETSVVVGGGKGRERGEETTEELGRAFNDLAVYRRV